jgi:fucose 4-O-acetylase-like acetyltransferase
VKKFAKLIVQLVIAFIQCVVCYLSINSLKRDVWILNKVTGIKEIGPLKELSTFVGDVQWFILIICIMYILSLLARNQKLAEILIGIGFVISVLCAIILPFKSRCYYTISIPACGIIAILFVVDLWLIQTIDPQKEKAFTVKVKNIFQKTKNAPPPTID